MTIDHLKDRIPDHAKDLRINLGVIAAATALTPQQAWGTAITARSPRATRRSWPRSRPPPRTSRRARAAARAAASIMGMNNIYYRFVHIMGDGAPYGQMPARLRMQIIGKPGVDHLDFELWCLAASAITGCEACVRAHEQSVRDKRGTPRAGAGGGADRGGGARSRADARRRAGDGRRAGGRRLSSARSAPSARRFI